MKDCGNQLSFFAQKRITADRVPDGLRAPKNSVDLSLTPPLQRGDNDPAEPHELLKPGFCIGILQEREEAR